jgi:hypothetical protein
MERTVKYGEGKPIKQASDTEKRFAVIRDMPQEVFAVMSLNGANRVLKIRLVTVGLLDSNQVHTREVFADPITDRAASIIVTSLKPQAHIGEAPTRKLPSGILMYPCLFRNAAKACPWNPAEALYSATGRPCNGLVGSRKHSLPYGPTPHGALA